MVGVISLYPFNNIHQRSNYIIIKEKEVKVIKNRKIILECVSLFFILTHPIELPP